MLGLVHVAAQDADQACRSAGSRSHRAAADRRQAAGVGLDVARDQMAQGHGLGQFAVRAALFSGHHGHGDDGGDAVVAAARTGHDRTGRARHADVGGGTCESLDFVDHVVARAVGPDGQADAQAPFPAVEAFFRHAHVHFYALEHKRFQFVVDGAGQVPEGLDVHGLEFLEVVGGRGGLVRGFRGGCQNGFPVDHYFVDMVVAVAHGDLHLAGGVAHGRDHGYAGRFRGNGYGDLVRVHHGLGPVRVLDGDALQYHEALGCVARQGPQCSGHTVAPQSAGSRDAHVLSVFVDVQGKIEFDGFGLALEPGRGFRRGQGHGDGFGATHGGLDFILEELMQVHMVSLLCYGKINNPGNPGLSY